MSFKPYSIYATRLPVLKPGHILKIGDRFYLITTVRRNRKKVSLTGAQTKYRFYTAQSAEYTPMVGNIDRNRVVHLQYVALGQAVATKFWWLTEPLLSKEREESVDSTTAPLDAPLEIDRWSFREEMHLYVTTAGDQDFYFEIIEYEVQPYEGIPERPYLYIMATGQAIFIEAAPQEEAARLLAQKASAELARARSGR